MDVPMAHVPGTAPGAGGRWGPVARRKCWTSETVTDALRERFIECGGAITLGEWDRRGYSPTAPTITATFGGWDAACEAAGFAPPARRKPRWTREVLVALGRDVLKRRGRALTMAEWRAEVGPRPQADLLGRIFGGWDKFWAACGADPPPRKRSCGCKRAWTRERVLGAAAEALREHGRPLRMIEWTALRLRPSRATVIRLMGSWEELWVALGQPPPPAMKWGRDDVAAVMRAVFESRGRVLPEAEWTRENLTPGATTVRRRFGTWRDACEAAMAAAPRDGGGQSDVRSLEPL